MTRRVGETEILRCVGVWLCLVSLLCVTACSQKAPPEIETVRFGRDALEVVLNGEVPVAAVSVFEGQEKVGKASPKARTNRIIVDVSWRPGHTYRIQVMLKGKPTPLEVSKIAPARSEPLVTGCLELKEEVVPWQMHESRYLGGRTAASSCGRYGAVGTEKSNLYVLDLSTAKPLWQKRLGEGRLLFLTFTPSGKYLLVGEQSRDGYLYCFETATGRTLWKFRAADEVGESEPGSGCYPVIDYIALGQSGLLRCYVAAKRQYWKDGDYFYHSRICCLDISTGRVIWRYPHHGTMDAGPSKVAVDAAQHFVVFNNFKRMPVCDQAVYCLDAASGRLLWNWVYPPLYEGHKQLTWRGVDISEDGRHVVVFAQDGRVFFLENPLLDEPPDDRPKLLWQKAVTRPIRVGEMDIYGYGAVARFKGPYLFLASGTTHAFGRKKAALSIQHPAANTLFAFDRKGKLLWMYKLGGLAYNIEVSDNLHFLLMPVRCRRSQSETTHQGVYLFDLNAAGGGADKLIWHYHTPGICLAGSLSGDGRRLLALEYPLDMDLQEEFVDVRGAHRVHCLR